MLEVNPNPQTPILPVGSFSAATAGGTTSGTVASMARALAAEPLISSDELLIDLRANPGGHFPSGVEAAKLFLPADATVVSTVDRSGNLSPILTFSAGAYASSTRSGRRIYVLVDRGTASGKAVCHTYAYM